GVGHGREPHGVEPERLGEPLAERLRLVFERVDDLDPHDARHASLREQPADRGPRDAEARGDLSLRRLLEVVHARGLVHDLEREPRPRLLGLRGGLRRHRDLSFGARAGVTGTSYPGPTASPCAGNVCPPSREQTCCTSVPRRGIVETNPPRDVRKRHRCPRPSTPPAKPSPAPTCPPPCAPSSCTDRATTAARSAPCRRPGQTTCCCAPTRSASARATSRRTTARPSSGATRTGPRGRKPTASPATSSSARSSRAARRRSR